MNVQTSNNGNFSFSSSFFGQNCLKLIRIKQKQIKMKYGEEKSSLEQNFIAYKENSLFIEVATVMEAENRSQA